MVRATTLFKLNQAFNKQLKETQGETYHSGLIGESLIAASYKMMTISELRKMNILLNQILKQKIEFKRVEELKRYHVQP